MHKIFSNLKGFGFFNFLSFGNGWIDGLDNGDKDIDEHCESPGGGAGCGDLDGDEEGDGEVNYYYFGDGNIGDGHGNSSYIGVYEREFSFDDET